MSNLTHLQGRNTKVKFMTSRSEKNLCRIRNRIRILKKSFRIYNTAEQEGVSKKQKEIKLGTIVENKEISTEIIH
jgi:hypothetical protein